MASISEGQLKIKKLSQSFEQLKIQFQFYFQGIEKLPPVADRDRLKKAVNKLQGDAKNWNTGDRFKLNSLKQKLQSHNRMWERTLKEIELGTYKPHLRKLKLKEKKELEAERDALLKAHKNDPMKEEVAEEEPPKRRLKSSAMQDMDDAKLQKLYRVYMQAKKRTGERSNLTFDTLKAQITKQVPRIKAKHKCNSVDFKVVLKNGKATLKAVPK